MFCGAEDQKISKEHLWSKWMGAHVQPAGGGSNTKSRLLATKTGRVEKSETWPEAPFGQEISGPCKRCNESWMEQIEAEARPSLILMLEDRAVEHRPEAQRAIARWATLKLLVAHLGHPPEKQSIPAARYRQFLSTARCPPARVWLARYGGAGAWPTDYRYLQLFLTMNGGIETELSNGYLAAFSVGHLTFFYWGNEFDRGPIPEVTRVDSHLRSAWPATGTASWPPKRSLDGDGIRYVMDRFPVDCWVAGPGRCVFQCRVADLTALRSDHS